ncbi:MAG TPA: hypothetical protein VJH03_26570 [Blastocatellia bacterium]|nr:hypothetical protein [Blastocatellia bacterium]
MTSSATAPLSLPESPYRGIDSFRYADQAIFFAREEETRKLLRYVTIYRGVLFYGESGSGKSSLINAGLIPATITEGFTPERLRVQPPRNEEIVVERISIPGDGKAPFLPSVFADDEERPRIVLSISAFMEKLRAAAADRQPLLIFDQFEEFVTLFEEAPRGEALKEAQAAQQAILQAVVELMRDPRLGVKLLFTFREDYLAKLTKLFVLCPELPDQYLRLTTLRTKALDNIIRGPFERFPGSFRAELSPELAQDLAAAIDERTESGALSLSEVQIACRRLWESPDPGGLFKQRGVQGLLEDYLSDALNQLAGDPPSPAMALLSGARLASDSSRRADDLRDPAVALLSRLVTAAGTRNVVSEEDLIGRAPDGENIPEGRLKAALNALVEDTKLVRRERRYNTYFYDIVSEFLVPWISQKKVERLAEIERRRLEEADRVRRRRLYWLVGICLMAALVIASVAVLVIQTRTEAAIARTEVRDALADRDSARQEIEARGQAAYEKAVRDDLVKKADDARAFAEMGRADALFAEEAALAAYQEAEKARKELDGKVSALTTKAAALEQERDEAIADATNGRDEMRMVAEVDRLRQLSRQIEQQGLRAEGEINRLKSAYRLPVDCNSYLALRKSSYDELNKAEAEVRKIREIVTGGPVRPVDSQR